MAIRSSHFFWLFMTLCGQLSTATFAKEIGLLECVLKKSSTTPELKDLENVFKEISSLPQGAQNFLVSQDNQRIQLASQLMGNDVLNTNPWYRQSVGPDGKIAHQFRLGNMLSEEWDKPEFIQQAADAICGAYFAEIKPFCVEGFIKRRENYLAFYNSHRIEIEELAESLDSKSPRSVNVKTDSVTDGNLRYGSVVSMPMRYLIGKYGFPPIVQNKNGQPVGVLVQISNEGVTEYYFAEFVGSGNLLTQSIRWPYSMIFGQQAQNSWNQVFIQKYGELYVDARPYNSKVPLDQYISDASSRKGS